MAAHTFRALSILSMIGAIGIHAQVRDGGGTTAAGAATIAGQVVTSAEPAHPIRRAIVSVAGDTGHRDHAVTDDAGRFEIRRVPPGRYTVSAAKTAYLPSVYGAARPGRTGTQVVVTADARVDVTLRMARGAVVTGTVRDDHGRPAPGVEVQATNVRASETRANLAPVMTDDRGVFRIFGLMPGDYFIVGTIQLTRAEATEQRSASEIDAILAALRLRSPATTTTPSASAKSATKVPEPAGIAFAPTFFPGVPDVRRATRVTVGPEEERDGLDFVLAPVRAAAIEGTISGPVPDLAAVQLMIAFGAGDQGPYPASFRTGPTGPRAPTGEPVVNGTPILSTPPDASGRFRYTNVLPGEYRIVANVTRTSLAAVADVDVQGQDVSAVVLNLRPRSSFSGRIQFEATASQPLKDLTIWRARLTTPSGRAGGFVRVNNTLIGDASSSPGLSPIRADGTFTVTGIMPGSYEVQLTGPELSRGWVVRSAMLNGRDLLDFPPDFAPGVDISGVVITVTDRRTELVGTLQTPTGTPAPDYFVIAFPSEPTLWRAGSRRVQTTRPATDGAFALRGLPPGRYLLAALTDVTAEDWNDPSFLRQAALLAVPVALRDGERTVQDIRLAGAAQAP